MPLDNTLNVSELLRRLGVKGDSLGSAPLLESLRLGLLIGDLSDLVPPLAVPHGGAHFTLTPGALNANAWTLHCLSPGGLRVERLQSSAANTFNLWITPANPFGAPVLAAGFNYTFGQVVQSVFQTHPAAPPVAPANTFRMHPPDRSELGWDFDTWVGPGEFFNIESTNLDTIQTMAIFWKEYPGALNPG